MNQTVLTYLRINEGRYPLEALKKKILSKGYTRQDIEEALEQLQKEKQYKPKREPQRVIRTPYYTSIERSGIRKQKKGKRWMKILGTTNFFLLLLGVLFLLYDLFMAKNSLLQQGALTTTTAIVLIFFMGLFIIIRMIGFLKLGRHTKTKLLKVSTVMEGVTLLLFLVLIIASFISLLKTQLPSTIPTLPFTSSPLYLGSLLLLTILWLLSKYLFSAAIIRINKSVPLSLTTGTLNLIVTIVITLYFALFLYLVLNLQVLTNIILDLFGGTPLYLLILRWIALGTIILLIITLFLETLLLRKASKIYE